MGRRGLRGQRGAWKRARWEGNHQCSRNANGSVLGRTRGCGIVLVGNRDVGRREARENGSRELTFVLAGVLESGPIFTLVVVNKVCYLWEVDVSVETIDKSLRNWRNPRTQTGSRESRGTAVKPVLDAGFRWMWGMQGRKPRRVKDDGDMIKT